MLRKGIDVVHARGHVPGLMGLALERLLGVKLLFDLRGLMAEEYVEAGRWRRDGVAFRATKWVEEKLFAAGRRHRDADPSGGARHEAAVGSNWAAARPTSR